jgi:hypothetical protein
MYTFPANHCRGTFLKVLEGTPDEAYCESGSSYPDGWTSVGCCFGQACTQNVLRSTRASLSRPANLSSELTNDQRAE